MSSKLLFKALPNLENFGAWPGSASVHTLNAIGRNPLGNGVSQIALIEIAHRSLTVASHCGMASTDL